MTESGGRSDVTGSGGRADVTGGGGRADVTGVRWLNHASHVFFSRLIGIKSVRV